MSNIDRDALRKGSAAIDEALESRKRNGDFRPFLSNIYWKDDKDYRYIMFLNPLEEIPEVDLHPYIDCDDDRPHMAIARTTRAIGEPIDPLREKWDYKPRLTNLAVAVELEPTVEVINGRPKPIGFEVKTLEYERKIYNDDNEDTGETETAVIPVVGLVAQSPFNFFNQLRAFDATEAPIHTTPLKVTRLGKKENVTYNVVGYDSIKPDLTNLLEYIENMSYVTEPEQLLEAIEAAGDDTEQATIAIGDYLLYKRIDELADPDLYDEIFKAVTKPAKYGEKKEEKTDRKAKPSQRRSKDAEEPAARTRSAEEKVTKESPADVRMAKLRQRGKAAAKSE